MISSFASAALRNRLVASGRAQPDRERSLPDRPGQRFSHRPAARLKDADPDRRHQRPRQVGQVAQQNGQRSLAGIVGRGRLDITAVAGEFLLDQAETEAREIGIGVVVETDQRLRLDPKPGSRRAVIVARLDLDRKRLGRADRLVGGRQLRPSSCGGTKSSTWNSATPIGGAFGSTRNSTRQAPRRASRGNAKLWWCAPS